MWTFESDSTLADAVEGRLGPFPFSIADLFVRNYEQLDEDEADVKVRIILKLKR